MIFPVNQGGSGKKPGCNPYSFGDGKNRGVLFEEGVELTMSMLRPCGIKIWRRRTGVALLYGLALVALLTVTILSLAIWVTGDFRSSMSYSESIRADELARGAGELVVAELRAEILAGSIDPEDPDDWESAWGTPPGEKARFYIPRKDDAGRTPGMRPWRGGTSAAVQAAIPNLVRSSSRSVPAWPDGYRAGAPGPLAASAASSETLALGGQRVSARRWNGHGLMPPASGSNLEPPSAFVPPDWIYVTRRGVGLNGSGAVLSAADLGNMGNPAPGNLDFAVGRFAYQIFEVGGLLDINVAGYPSGVPTEEVARKGSLGLVDLSAVPGINNPAALVGWRNQASAAAGAFAELTLPSPDAHPYLKYLFNRSANGGFLSPHAGDERFMSRRDLIQYARANPGVIDFRALPHVTTFNRSVNRPVFFPSNPRDVSGNEIPRLNSVDYEREGMMDGATARAGLSALYGHGWPASRVFPVPNRSPLRVVVPEGVDKLRDWDGNEIDVEPGQPIPLPRFPLERIDLFRQYYEARIAGQPTAELEEKIKWSFGLVPDPAAPGEIGRWFYIRRVYLPENTPHMRLMNLDEVVRSDVRAGPSPTNPNTHNIPPNPTDPLNPPRLPNFFELLQAGILRGDIGYGETLQIAMENHLAEVLQIGANIIDQYDEDVHPTLIRAYAQRLSTAFRNVVVVGKENLPMISEMILTGYRPTSSGPERKQVRPTIEFELWNVHQNAGAWEGPALDFRLIATGEGQLDISPQPPQMNVVFNPDTHSIRFRYPEASTFKDPVLLHPDLPSISNNSETAGEDYGPEGPHRLFGINLPALNAPDEILSPSDPDRKNYTGVILRRVTDILRPQFELQYLDTRLAPPAWKTMNTIRFSTNSPGWPASYATSGSPPGATTVYPGSATPNWATSGGRPMTESGQRVSARHTIDPRRSVFLILAQHRYPPTPNASLRPGRQRMNLAAGWYQFLYNADRESSMITGPRIPVPGGNANVVFPEDLIDNLAPNSSSWFMRGYDGIRRPTDADASRGILPTTNSERNWFLDRLIANHVQSGFNTPGDISVDRLRDRPVHLNRPFRSVAELGYVFAEQPWKTLDFRSHLSPHTGLLELFSVNESGQPVEGGKINVNAASRGALAAIVAGAGRNPLVPGERISPGQAEAIADEIRAALAQHGPLLHRGQLVEILGRRIHAMDNANFPFRKTEREAVIRAVAEVGEVRTWNLLIDVVAQTGRFVDGASSLDQFRVSGERRYWLWVAIDRLTGEVVARNLEPVYE